MAMNTKSTGRVSFITAKPSNSDYYVGFCYELAIVLEDKNPDKLISELYEAAKGYIQVARENNLPDNLLDKHEMLPKDLQDLYTVVKNSVTEDVQPNTKNKISNEYSKAVSMGGAQLSIACV
jgi:hypothetical protein